MTKDEQTNEIIDDSAKSKPSDRSRPYFITAIVLTVSGFVVYAIAGLFVLMNIYSLVGPALDKDSAASSKLDTLTLLFNSGIVLGNILFALAVVSGLYTAYLRRESRKAAQ